MGMIYTWGYFIDIQRVLVLRPGVEIEGNEGDEPTKLIDTLAIYAGDQLESAFDLYTKMRDNAVSIRSDWEYIRFRFTPEGTGGYEAVLAITKLRVGV